MHWRCCLKMRLRAPFLPEQHETLKVSLALICVCSIERKSYYDDNPNKDHLRVVSCFQVLSLVFLRPSAISCFQCSNGLGACCPCPRGDSTLEAFPVYFWRHVAVLWALLWSTPAWPLQSVSRGRGVWYFQISVKEFL